MGAEIRGGARERAPQGVKVSFGGDFSVGREGRRRGEGLVKSRVLGDLVPINAPASASGGFLCDALLPGRALSPFVIVLSVLPELTDGGELPPGVHIAEWQEFEARFGGSSPRRLWLLGRLRTLLDLASTSGELRRVFIWGSFVTGKPAPKDLDILLIMSDGFEVDRLAAPVQAIFDSTRARLLFESDVFWARASIGGEVLRLWLDTYQTSRDFRKRGIVELVLP